MNLEMDQTRRLPPHHALKAAAPVVGTPALTVRLAQAILALAECTEIDVGNSIFITGAISNERLAGLAAAKPKPVARMIEQFILRGLVEKRRERFIIRQPGKLLDIIAKAV